MACIDNFGKYVIMVLEALSYTFVQKALVAGIAVALICSFMGTFLVLRRYSLFGDGIAHVAFGGISVGLFLGVFPLMDCIHRINILED